MQTRQNASVLASWLATLQRQRLIPGVGRMATKKSKHFECRLTTERECVQGWSLAMVTQYDIELVQEVEATVGATLEQYDLPEKEVLSNITTVHCLLLL